MMCCCEDCMLAHYYQSALNKWRLNFYHQQIDDAENLPSSTEEEEEEREAAKNKARIYNLQAFTPTKPDESKKALHAKAKDAARCM